MISEKISNIPLILAPAGNRAGFLAALAAGAEAVYCGLKQLSARMEAKNFTLQELAALAELARSKGTRVFVTVNTVIKPEELDLAGRLLDDLNRWVHPEALIIQDLAVIELARQTGFTGELHLSTLANVGIKAALPLVNRIKGVSRVVLPRELNVDEIRTLADACPEGLGLEVFVHGALCYGVSGRCYWSSFLGGKSGLRGRCVQPCRRLYRQGNQEQRFFSCQDLSLDVLVKVLLSMPAIKGWKIEGRKKGPHYVYYTVRAYKLLRDHPGDGQAKKEALELLQWALGRNGTHYGFLSQRPSNPIRTGEQTASGLLLGKLNWKGDTPFFILKQQLLTGDVIRVGYEDEAWHRTQRINRSLESGSRFFLPSLASNKSRPEAPVFLIDRREPEMMEKILVLEGEMKSGEMKEFSSSGFKTRPSRPSPPAKVIRDQKVFRLSPKQKPGREEIGLWLAEESVQAGLSLTNIWWWLSPVIWPADEARTESLIAKVLKKGFSRFVLNAPWQMGFFQNPKTVTLWAGPFCNLSNGLAIQQIKTLGFQGAMVSPELGEADFLSLARQSPLPLGMVLSGNFPLCISRILSERLKTDQPFQSPRGETAWAVQEEGNYWIYPNWKLDWSAFRRELERAGYVRFVHLIERVPRSVEWKERPGTWNWNIGLP
ncbi:MAG: peptidase U32 family protein [Thermodesulfobacteriota bacterium]